MPRVGLPAKGDGNDMGRWDCNWQRLPLDGTVNTRELGGYPVAGGGQTAWHRFLRSDALCELTDSDVEFLRGYGVSLVLDLRGADEATQLPDRSLGDGVLYRNVTLIDFDAADAEQMRALLESGEVRAGEAYVPMIENRDAVASAMRAVLEVPTDRCVLFHCHAGKDRTGVLAMVLLALAGVDRQDIVANYAQTRPNLLRREAYRLAFERSGEMREVIDSLPETMSFSYDYMVSTYGDAEGYLRACGLASDELDGLRAHLLSDVD